MVTQAEAVTKVRERLDETTAATWTNEQLRGWINEAMRDVARLSETIQSTATITITSTDITNGVQEWTLDGTTLRVYRVEYKPTGQTNVYPLEYGDFNNLDAVWWTRKTISTGTPQMFTLWGYPPQLKIVLYPKPALAGTLTVYYYKVPADLATDGTAAATTLSVPNGWEDLVYEYVTYLALRRDRDPRWQEAKQAYDEKLAAMVDLTARWSDQSGSITPSGSMLPDWLIHGYE
jgi:hypothetical protein